MVDSRPQDGLVLTADDLIAVVTFKGPPKARVATFSVTRRNVLGQWDLIALLHSPCPAAPQKAVAEVQAQWEAMQAGLRLTTGVLSLKDAQYAYSQEEITHLASAHLAATRDARNGLPLEGASVVQETAMMWHLLSQFGSFRPAEVISALTGVKPRTINARLKAARDKGLIPPTRRGVGVLLEDGPIVGRK